MDWLVTALQALGVPVGIAGAAVTLALIAQQLIKAWETKQEQAHSASDSDIKQNSAILKNLIEDLTEAKQREDDCSRKIASMTKERDAWLVREESLNRQIAEAAAQRDALFVIMRRDASHPGEGTTERELTRMRQWMVDHIADADLDLVAADVELAKPIYGAATGIKALALIEEARQRNLLKRLEDTLLARVPTVPRW